MHSPRHHGEAGRRLEKLEARRVLSATAFVANSQLANSTSHFASADLDGDSDIDLIADSRDESGIVWYENEDGLGNFGQPTSISSAGDFSLLAVADVDGDGDTDIILTANEQVVLLENLDGAGNFDEKVVIGERVRNGRLLVADIDGDGDLDVVSGSSWYQFNTADGSFGIPHRVEIDGMEVNVLGSGDFDSDGDLDLLSWADGSDFVWLENQDGKGSFGQPNLVRVRNDSVFYRAGSGDFDGDGDADIWIERTGGFESQPNVWLYENTDGRGTFVERTRTELNTDSSLRYHATGTPCLSDFDSDGDLDILLSWGAFWITGEDRPPGVGFIYENIGSDWGFELADRPISSTPEFLSLFSSGSCAIDDIDGDGDEDVAISLSDRGGGFLEWHENRLTGDTDDDGVVNFADFLALSTNFGKATDAVWQEGDFDADGKIDFSDFLALAANFGNQRHSQV